MNSNTIDSVIVGKRFEELIAKKQQLEQQLKKEQSKCRTKLWNEKEQKEQQCQQKLIQLQEQKEKDMQTIYDDYLAKQKQYETQHIENVNRITEEIQNVKHNYTTKQTYIMYI